MRPIKAVDAGNAKKDDVLVRITPASREGIELHITSTVLGLCEAQIRTVISGTLAQHDISGAVVEVADYGALDFALRARTETAILRSCGGEKKC